jgi:hypothetical protein
MLKITPKSIKDFQTCGLLYEYRHNQGLAETIPGRQIITDRFEETLINVINFFFYKKQSGSSASYSALQNRWQKLWFPKSMSAQDVINEKHETAYGNTASLTSKATSALMNFHEYFSNPEIIPVGISEEYSFPIGKILVEGVFDLIYALGDRIYVIKWMFNAKDSNSHLHNTDFACMYYAYKNKNATVSSSVKFGYYDIMDHNPSVKTQNLNNDDVESIKFWVEELSDKKNFFPRRGLTFYCKRCPFDTPCSKWSFKNLKD